MLAWYIESSVLDLETNMKRTLTIAALIALGALAYAPLPSMAGTDVSVVIGTAPPPLRYEVVPAPRRGYVWAPGHWEWRGHRHEWVTGYWIAERPGYAYSAPAWARRDGGWYYEPARWTPYGRDRDRDGIPDRYERRRHDEDHDGVPNRYDRDRDGDGVPNRYDRDPDNRWRR
jgi:hypothetical protein